MRVSPAIFTALLFVVPMSAANCADILPLDDALRATYTACVGIDDELSDLKKMAGINTAVTAVGTATAGGATVVGIVKASKDREAEELDKLIKKLEELTKDKPDPTDAEKEKFFQEFEESYDNAVKNLEETKKKLDSVSNQSKRLGNWRTGLIATSTATNVAGAIIAGTGQNTGDLQTMIDGCKAATENLRQSIGQARISGEDVTEARAILTACDEYNYVDISKITNRGKGAMISSIVGSATGAAGTVTSAMANSGGVRGQYDAREKNLNTAANVLSGATAAASATATVFNATQISAIKKVANVAEKCTGVLK